MAWKVLTADGLTASLSRREAEAFRASSEGVEDPVESLVASTASFVRGCVRSGGRAALSQDPLAIPESLVPAATDYIRWQLLSRHDIVVNESRTKAYEAALALFEKVRSGDFVPESDGEDDAPRVAALAPECGKPNPDKRLLD